LSHLQQRILRSPRYEPRDDSGFTLTELLVVTAVFMIVVSALLTTLEVAQRQQRRTESIVDNQLQVTNAMQVMTREIRAANPIDVTNITDSSIMKTSITVKTGSQSSNSVKTWRFYLNSNRQLIAQTVLGGSSQGTYGIVLLKNVVNAPKQPLFRYFDEFQAELTPGVVSASTISSCATKVVIDVVSRPEFIGAPDYEGVTEVELRNKLPGGTGCQRP